ncbi:MAG: hypothetical protein ACI9OJ_001681 [Myxococcota bacterium]|jgi:hypothetical protein
MTADSRGRRAKHRTETVRITDLKSAPAAGALASELFSSYGLPQGALGALEFVDGSVFVEIDARQARRLKTPCPLVLSTGRGVLRRASDLPPTASSLRVRWNHPVVTAGEFAKALSTVGVAGEDLGPIKSHNGALETTLPRWRYRVQDFPTALSGQSLEVTQPDEKKKPDTTGELTADTAVEALESATLAFSSPPDLARATRRALSGGRHSEALLGAARRLASVGYRPTAKHISFDPGLVVLTMALNAPTAWEKELRRLESIPFPTPADAATINWLEQLQSERQGELSPTDPLASAVNAEATKAGYETRALGTLCPGLRHDDRPIDVPPGAEADGLWGAWLEIASETASGRDVDVAIFDYLDDLVTSAASDAGRSTGTWPELLSLVKSEAAGVAEPVYTALEQLQPGSERWESTVLRNVDLLVRTGRWKKAASAADDALATATSHQARTGAPIPAQLVRRVVRLTGRTDAVISDPVVLVLAAESLWKAGKVRDAGEAFEIAAPDTGSPAADHAARRLLDLRRWADADQLLAAESDLPLILRAHVALERWDKAVPLWAFLEERAGGVWKPPSWADASVRALLSPTLRSILTGDKPSRYVAPTQPAGTETLVLKRVFGTPDARSALRALAGCDDATIDRCTSLAKRLIAQVDEGDWDWETSTAVVRIARAAPDLLTASNLQSQLSRWLDSDLAPALAPLIAQIQNRSDELDVMHSHCGIVRLDAAMVLVSSLPEDAAQIAISVLKRTGTRQARVTAVELLERLGKPKLLVAVLSPERDPRLLEVVLETLVDPTPELAESLTTLKDHARKSIRLAAARLLDRLTSSEADESPPSETSP